MPPKTQPRRASQLWRQSVAENREPSTRATLTCRFRKRMRLLRRCLATEPPDGTAIRWQRRQIRLRVREVSTLSPPRLPEEIEIVDHAKESQRRSNTATRQTTTLAPIG